MLYYNSDKEIQKLKQKLMSKSNESKSDVLQQVKQLMKGLEKFSKKTSDIFQKLGMISKKFLMQIKYFEKNKNMSFWPKFR